MAKLEKTENFIHDKYGYCYYDTKGPVLIYNLFVEPQYRRKGHARRLVQLVIAKIREEGYIGPIEVQVEPFESGINPAMLAKFYERMGLTIMRDSATKMPDEMLQRIVATQSFPTTVYEGGVKYQSHELASEVLHTRQDNAALKKKLRAAEEALRKIAHPGDSNGSHYQVVKYYELIARQALGIPEPDDSNPEHETDETLRT